MGDDSGYLGAALGVGAEYQPAADFAGEGAEGFDPLAETGLVLGFLGDEDHYAGDGVDGDVASRQHHHLTCALDKLFDFRAEECVDDARLAVHSHKYGCDVALVDGVEDAGDGVEVVSLY